MPTVHNDPYEVSTRKRQASLVFIFITMLIDVLGFGLVTPVMPKLVTELSGNSASHAAHAYGLLLSTYGLMQFLFSPVLGNLSDRYGRRPVLLLSMAFNMADYVIIALAPTVSWLFVGRILSGITAASMTVATSYIADITPPEKRAQSFGLVGASFGIGFIIGPMIGGSLGMISLRAPFWAAAVLSILNCAYGAFILPESLRRENRRPLSRKSLNPFLGIGILGRHSWVLVLTTALAVLSLSQLGLQSTWVLYTTYRFHWTPKYNGVALALIGLGSAIVQIVILRVLIPKIGERRAVVIGMCINFLGLLGFAFATKTWMMFALVPVWCLSGITGPSIQGLLSKQYGPNEQGGVQGAINSVQSLIGVVAPLLATWVFSYFTSTDAPAIIPGAPFLLGAVFVIIAIVLAVIAMRRHKDSATTEFAA